MAAVSSSSVVRMQRSGVVLVWAVISVDDPLRKIPYLSDHFVATAMDGWTVSMVQLSVNDGSDCFNEAMGTMMGLEIILLANKLAIEYSFGK